MDTRGIIAIVVAIIGLIGVVIGDIIQVFRQGKPVNEIKSDTSYIKPKIDTIDDNTKKVRDEVVEKIVPHLNTSEVAIQDISSKVETLYQEEEYKKRIRSEFSTSLNNKDYFIEGIEQIYTENGKLNQENRELSYKLHEMYERNMQLTQKNNELDSNIFQLKRMIVQLQKDINFRNTNGWPYNHDMDEEPER